MKFNGISSNKNNNKTKNVIKSKRKKGNKGKDSKNIKRNHNNTHNNTNNNNNNSQNSKINWLLPNNYGQSVIIVQNGLKTFNINNTILNQLFKLPNYKINKDLMDNLWMGLKARDIAGSPDEKQLLKQLNQLSIK